MKVTDYSKIAKKYDQNHFRLEEVQYDLDLKEYISQNKKSEYHFLDLACGTGIYLHKQLQYFQDKPIKWNGLDASIKMLSKAKGKLGNVDLIQGLAERMPYQSNRFDYIANNYAFHHFTDKEKALDEIVRVLNKGGILKLHNLSIHEMPNWWIYHYFPSAYDEDTSRFWQKDVLFNELVIRGMDVKIKINYQMNTVKIADYLHHAENRDISILTLISDEEYQDGLDRMKKDLQQNPNQTIVNDFAELFCIARKI